MKRQLFSLLLIACLTTCFLSGCILVSADFRQTKELILDELGPADIDTEFQLQIGPGMISLGEIAVSFSPANNEAIPFLRDIRNIQVGVYKLQQLRQDCPLTIPDPITKKLARKGYEPIVKVKEKTNSVWVMTKVTGKHLESLYVISLEPNELVLVEVQGRLERLIEKAIREHGFNKKEFMEI